MPSLKDLPVEVYARIVPFLNRQGLLTFYEVVEEAQAVVVQISNHRLGCLCQSWDASVEEQSSNDARRRNQIRQTIRQAVTCIRQHREPVNNINPQQQQEEEDCQRRRRHYLEETLVMKDLFSFPTSKNLSPGRVIEWPIWCGRIQALVWVPRGSFHGMQRVLVEANAMLVSPNWAPVHYRAWDSLSNDNNTIQLVAESYNFVPTTPVGRLVGLTPQDQETLTTLALQLMHQNTVAVPPPGRLQSRQQLLQALRLVSRSQAKRRLQNMPASLPYRFYVEDDTLDDADLLCCWELRDLFQEATPEESTAQSLMPYWQAILQAREVAESQG